jgi:hypothetical protein
MRTLRQRGWASAALALSANLALLGTSHLHAEEKAVQKPSASALGAALQITRTRGVATVAVLTSAEQPSSVQIWKEFYEGAWARTNRGSVELVNVSKETDAGLVRTLNVSHFPTAIVYTRGPQGVRVLGTITDCNTAEDLVTRLRSLDLGLNAPAKADYAVTATALSSDNYPSGQTQCPAPTYCPPVTATAPQPQTTTLSVAPTQSLQATANVIQVPSQSLMIQQAPPQVFLAPTQAPIVYVPQTMAAGPTMSLSAGPAPSAPAGNLFLATPTLSASPAQQPTLALAASAPAPAATLAVAAGPGPLATVNNQTLSLPTSGNRTRVRVRGPGMLASSLARLGERMTRLGRSRIETINETTLEAPLNQGPSLGMATISTTSTQPVAQGPTLSVSPPQQPCEKPSCPANSPPSNLPSPQKQYSHGH